MHAVKSNTDAVPATELNYKSLADVWQYIIKQAIHTSTILFLLECVVTVNRWYTQFENDYCLHCINEYECDRPCVAELR